MTFTEAAVEVLRREGKPLHFRKIAEIAIRENLLDHVGKIPEETMADQLAAHARLPHTDRRVTVVQHGTFALEEWGLPEDPSGLVELVPPPPQDEPPYRGRERHPIPMREMGRGVGRDGGRRRREEGEEKHRRFPPPAEVAYEILAGAERTLTLRELAAMGAERMLMPDAFVRETRSLAAALLEDNRRRESAGRKPLFTVDGENVSLGAAPEPGERPAVAIAARAPVGATEMRHAAMAALRRRLRECDGSTVEWLVGRLLEKTDYREVKVAKRGRESVLLTARRRMGLADVRHVIRVVRNGADVSRRDVTDVRRDIGNYGAQIGVLLTAGEAQRDARGEATASGQTPVFLLCGEAFAEAFADAGVACRQVIIPEVDEGFLAQAVEAAQREEAARMARRDERDRRDRRDDGERERDRGRGRREEPRPPAAPPESIAASAEAPTPPAETAPAEAPPAAPEAIPAVAPAPAEPSAPRSAGEPAAAEGDDEGGDSDEGDDDALDAAEGAEGPEGPETAAAAAGGGAAPGEPGKEPGEGRRRRRRRRRRGGRGRGGPRPEGAAGAGPGGEAVAQDGNAHPPPSGGDAPAPRRGDEPSSGTPGGGEGSTS